jgi:hypothetical protein
VNGAVDLSNALSRAVDRYEFGGTSPAVIFGDIVIVGNSVNDRTIYDGDPRRRAGVRCASGRRV